MQIILTEDVDNLGKRGDVVKVTGGYGRNFLLPKRLAVEATTGNMRVLEQRRSAFARRETREKGEAELLCQQLAEFALAFGRKAGDNGILYGSVTSPDIAHLLEARSFHIDRRKITLREPIKTTGQYDIPLKLHREVVAQLKVVVVPDTLREKSEAVGLEEFEKLCGVIAAAKAEAENAAKQVAADEAASTRRRVRKAERAAAENPPEEAAPETARKKPKRGAKGKGKGAEDRDQ
ncbi:MAG: 50S ribosomal protein L9 [Acidobacteriota bacterium]